EDARATGRQPFERLVRPERLQRFVPLVASYNVLAPPPSAAPTRAPFLPPNTAPMPAPAAVDPPTIIAVCFQSRPDPRSSCAALRSDDTRRTAGAVCTYGS